MTLHIPNPRGKMSLSATPEELLHSFHMNERRSAALITKKQPGKGRKPPCYDWIFSSATNVHLAIDKSAFRIYTHLNSYLLTVADQQRVAVKGIGMVDLKLRCKPGSRESRTITLENVLHVPDWYCNIFSDVYFQPIFEYDHVWSEAGILFRQKHNNVMRAWGFTESFCGLERLVLSRKLQGRSPMLEDKDREIWSINLHWPAYEREMWHERLVSEMNREANKVEAETKIHHQDDPEDGRSCETRKTHLESDQELTTLAKPGLMVPSNLDMTTKKGLAKQRSAISLDMERATNRVSLGEIDKNIPTRRDFSSKIGSLKATFSKPSLLKGLKSSPGMASMHGKESADRSL